MLEELNPIIISPLFPEIHSELIKLLKNLSAEDWQKPTICGNWTVKNVTQHLLGVEISNLSRRRDNFISDKLLNNWKALLKFINQSNQDWVNNTNYISTHLIIDLLDFVGNQTCTYFLQIDPYLIGQPVHWVGPEPAPVWLDLAREYTERWHHQQHIRDAVKKPGLNQFKYYSPFFDTFIRALPRTFEKVDAAEKTAITVTIKGKSGGCWSILREGSSWELFKGSPAKSDVEIIISQDNAWRLFTHGLSSKQSHDAIEIIGNKELGSRIYNMVAIIA